MIAPINKHIYALISIADLPVWTECVDCDEYWCNIHNDHVDACICPPMYVWANEDLSPYELLLGQLTKQLIDKLEL